MCFMFFSYRNQLCEQAKGNLCFRNALLTHVHRWQRSSYTLFVSGIGLLLFSSKSEMHSDVLCRSLSLLHLDLKMQLMCVFWFLHCYHGLVASKACITLWKVKSKTHVCVPRPRTYHVLELQEQEYTYYFCIATGSLLASDWTEHVCRSSLETMHIPNLSVLKHHDILKKQKQN